MRHEFDAIIVGGGFFGCSLALHVVGSLATASTFQVGASWYEGSDLPVIS